MLPFTRDAFVEVFRVYNEAIWPTQVAAFLLGVPAWALVIPCLWSLIRGSAAFLLAVPQDWLLLLSGVMSVPLILRKRWGAPGRFRRRSGLDDGAPAGGRAGRSSSR